MTEQADWRSLLPDGLDSLLAPVQEWTGRAPDELIPSYKLGSDGPVLNSVFCVFGDLLCEVIVTPVSSPRFDFVRVDRLLNLRFEEGKAHVGLAMDRTTMTRAIRR